MRLTEAQKLTKKNLKFSILNYDSTHFHFYSWSLSVISIILLAIPRDKSHQGVWWWWKQNTSFSLFPLSLCSSFSTFFTVHKSGKFFDSQLSCRSLQCSAVYQDLLKNILVRFFFGIQKYSKTHNSPAAARFQVKCEWRWQATMFFFSFFWCFCRSIKSNDSLISSWNEILMNSFSIRF